MAVVRHSVTYIVGCRGMVQVGVLVLGYSVCVPLRLRLVSLFYSGHKYHFKHWNLAFIFPSPEGEFLVKKVMSWEGIRT